MVPIDIITCPEWRAAPPRQGLTLVGRPTEIIFHHTAGHHHEISNPASESREEAIAYARDIQHFHMVTRGWLDSGHNFLVTRSGLILQGRWLTVSSIEAGHMVVSAHCPGHNHSPGIEHEHVAGEKMTAAQRDASARLIAWISWHAHVGRPLPVRPHKQFFPTDCPDNLVKEIPRIVAEAEAILAGL